MTSGSRCGKASATSIGPTATSGTTPTRSSRSETGAWGRYGRRKSSATRSCRALWYAGILLKRTMATLSQWKLLPWGPLGGRSIRPRSSYNEGAIDSYYALTANLDWFRIGPWLVEVPVPLFWIAVVAAFVLAFRRPAPEIRAAGLVLGIVLVATLALPVAITTAGALETQAIAVAYFLALALLADLGLRARRIIP
jgi:hypothetical protein